MLESASTGVNCGQNDPKAWALPQTNTCPMGTQTIVPWDKPRYVSNRYKEYAGREFITSVSLGIQDERRALDSIYIYISWKCGSIYGSIGIYIYMMSEDFLDATCNRSTK